MCSCCEWVEAGRGNGIVLGDGCGPGVCFPGGWCGLGVCFPGGWSGLDVRSPGGGRQGGDDRDEKDREDEGEGNSDGGLGDQLNGVSAIDDGHFVRVQRVIDEFEANEAEDRGEPVVQEDEAVEEAVDEEVELSQAEEGEGVGRKNEVGLLCE